MSGCICIIIFEGCSQYRSNPDHMWRTQMHCHRLFIKIRRETALLSCEKLFHFEFLEKQEVFKKPHSCLIIVFILRWKDKKKLFRWPIYCQLPWRQREFISRNACDGHRDTEQVYDPCPICTNCTVNCAETALSIRLNSWKRSTGSFRDFSKYFSAKIIKPNSFRFTM